MPFALWTRTGPKNHVLDGGPEVPRDVAMSTIFGLVSMGYNFGCVIASGSILILGVGFRGQAISGEDIAEIECPIRVVAVATNFGTQIAITGVCNWLWRGV